VLDGLLERPIAEGRFERPHIGPDDIAVEPECLLPEKQMLNVQMLALGINQLIEDVAGPLRVALGPEIRYELVPAHASLAGYGQEREQREPATLGRGAGERGVAARERDPTEYPQMEHARQLTP